MKKIQDNNDENIISVEIKPKCGFIPNSNTIHPDHYFVKSKFPNFRLQQLLKLKQVIYQINFYLKIINHLISLKYFVFFYNL